MASLRGRLNSGILIVATVLFIALLLLESFFIQRITQFHISTRLEHDTETLLLAVQADSGKDENQLLSLNNDKLHPIYLRPFSGHYFLIKTETQRIRSRSLWDEDMSLPGNLETLPALITLQGPKQESLLVYIDQFSVQGKPVTIATAESLAMITPMIREAQYWSALAAGVLVLVFVTLQYHWVKTSLTPLETLKQQLQSLQQGKLQQLSEPKRFTELKPLIIELNEIITALELRIKRSREATGNLTHALKTPIATLQQLCESYAEDNPELTQAISTQLQVIKQRLESELKRARIAGSKGPRTTLNIRDEIIELVSVLKRIHNEKNLSININIKTDLGYPCDRQDFLELTGNLLDNAFKWAEQQVSVTVLSDTGYLELIVEDDGPGCPPSALSQLAERGKRLDERLPGHGLGLSIANDIVKQYHGALSFSLNPEGGLKVQATLRHAPK